MTPLMVGSTWPRVRSTLESDCFPALSQGTALFHLIVDWLLVIFIVAAHIRCLVIEVVLVHRSLICLGSPAGYTYDHMYVHFCGSLYPTMDCTLHVWYGLLVPMSADASWGFHVILILIATVLGSRYFGYWYDNIGRCGLSEMYK